jgi:hypothetical protein
LERLIRWPEAVFSWSSDFRLPSFLSPSSPRYSDLSYDVTLLVSCSAFNLDPKITCGIGNITLKVAISLAMGKTVSEDHLKGRE